MAGSYFIDDEIKRLLAIEKRIPHEDWFSDRKGRDIGPGEKVRKWRLYCPTDPSLEFEVERVEKYHGYSPQWDITLSVRMPPRPWQAICRYDIHNTPHTNFPCCGNRDCFDFRQPHRHIYCPNCSEQIDRWHACAETLDAGINSMARLQGAFLADLNIHTESTAAHGDLFDEVR